MKRHTEIVSFRADEPLLNRIDSERKPLVLSRGDWVREVVIAFTHDRDDAARFPELVNSVLLATDRLEQRLERSETNQRRSLMILLRQLGVPLETAKQIVRSKLGS